ncbi:MAG: sensor histidine kinase [Phycisphaerae bacterium]
MLRGFRHTLFMLLQVGVVVSGLLALVLDPGAWRAILICVGGALLASIVCDRVARQYLRATLGRLRRLTHEISEGRTAGAIETHPHDDFYKLVSAINAVAARLDEARRAEQRLNEALRRRERLAFLGELAATVAHEVNNPLDGVQNCTRILRRSLHDPPRAAQMLDLIESGLTRIEVIVRRLLTLARHNVIRPVETRLRTVVAAALLATRDKLEAANVVAATHIDTEHDAAPVDASLLEQVFVNLILNAIDSMPRGGALTIRVQRESPEFAVAARLTRGTAQPPSANDAPDDPPAAEIDAGGGVLRIDFADAGGGIAPDVRPHIFEPFFTTKSDGQGTGLGLPIAARIVDAHRGALTVASEPGRGSVFTVRLPALPVIEKRGAARGPMAVRQ